MLAAFAKNLGQLRAEAGVSQKEAAAALGVSQALLSHYENGIREPGLEFVVRAADYYGVTTDVLLGCSTVQHVDFVSPTPCPSRFGQMVGQEVRDTVDILLDLLSRHYDPELYCYATLCLSEVLYELIRHFARMTPDYGPEGYAISDEAFDSGAVDSDLSWVRARYIMAARRYRDQGGELPHVTEEEVRANYGSAVLSAMRLVNRVGRRVSRLTASDVSCSHHLFEDTDPDTAFKSKEEEKKHD